MRGIENVFSVLYDTKVDIEIITGAGSYSNDTKHEKVCDVLADVQPYHSQGTVKEYGIFKDVQYVMYCSENSEIMVGRCAVIAGERFIIVGVQHRNLGMKVYLKEAA